MQRWRRSGPSRRRPHDAVAAAAGMLDEIAGGGGPAISWTLVSEPALVLGRTASDPPLDRDLADRRGIAIVGRRSGGGAVLWDRDLLALDVALPAGHALADRDVVRAYRWLGEALSEAMTDLGAIDVSVVSPERAHADRAEARATSAACFGSLSPYEVISGGRKLVGLSQVRRRHGALLQVGIPLRLDMALLSALLRLPPAARQALERRTVALDELVPGVGVDEVVAACEARLSARAGATLADGGNR